MGYRKYTAEFKREVLAMAAQGSRSIAPLERDLDITAGLIYKWQQRCRLEHETLQRQCHAGKLLSPPQNRVR